MTYRAYIVIRSVAVLKGAVGVAPCEKSGPLCLPQRVQEESSVPRMATIPNKFAKVAGFRVTRILHLKCTRIRHFRTKISKNFRVQGFPLTVP